tara:strand:- start:458 stop:1042 length:585 start_codon:yes stop_codon:yes gene_type:complete
LDREKFDYIKKCYGHVASWAIWDEHDIRNLDIFDIEKNPKTLTKLKPQIVLVGLNISAPLEDKFSNFHDAEPGSSTTSLKKLRYALSGTPLEGAYMTDVIKYFVQSDSVNVKNYLKDNPKIELENVESFRKEIEYLGVDNQVIVAMGDAAKCILDRNLEHEYRIKKIPHYGLSPLSRNEKNYKENVEEKLSDIF